MIRCRCRVHTEKSRESRSVKRRASRFRVRIKSPDWASVCPIFPKSSGKDAFSVSLTTIIQRIGALPPLGESRLYELDRDGCLLVGLVNCSGYASPGLLRRYLEYGEDRLNALRVASVGALRETVSRSEKAEKGSVWREVPDPMPRARLVTKAIVSLNPASDIDAIDDIRTCALTFRPIDLPGGQPGKVLVTDRTPGRILMTTEQECRQLLVVSESYHRGWRAYVDGVECPVERVYGDFMGCVIDGGAHQVEFRFAPSSLRMG